MSANEKQIGGDHYKAPGKLEHWDIVAMHDLDYFQGQITKYVMRWKKKYNTPEARLNDLRKALHVLEKYIELNTPKATVPDSPVGKSLSEYEEKTSAYLHDDRFLCEGGWGNKLNLYTCRKCSTKLVAVNLTQAGKKHTDQRCGEILTSPPLVFSLETSEREAQEPATGPAPGAPQGPGEVGY